MDYGSCNLVSGWSEYRREPSWDWYQKWGQSYVQKPKTMNSKAECLKVMDGKDRNRSWRKMRRTLFSVVGRKGE